MSNESTTQQLFNDLEQTEWRGLQVKFVTPEFEKAYAADPAWTAPGMDEAKANMVEFQEAQLPDDLVHYVPVLRRKGVWLVNRVSKTPFVVVESKPTVASKAIVAIVAIGLMLALYVVSQS